MIIINLKQEKIAEEIKLNYEPNPHTDFAQLSSKENTLASYDN